MTSGRDSRERGKRLAAEAALELVVRGAPLGVGTGSTANLFIDLLAGIRDRFDGAVASSRATAERLARHGIRVLDAAELAELPVYVDGADECNPRLELIKGGGGALTREKILASASHRFVCIADASKSVETLGRFPLPLEVIPFARAFVAARLERLGGRPRLRDGLTTDNGNIILDVRGLDLEDPPAMERTLNDIPGIVTNGLFALRPADVALLGTADGVKKLTRSP